VRATGQSNSDLLPECDLWEANVVLKEIVTQDPHHLTSEELVTRLEDDVLPMDRATILDTVAGLKRSGLLRTTGNVVEPTHTALCAAAIFQS
jgi:Fe2+ or Zn2+ uptake regulation protein